jgi:hypothetical protein
MRRLVMILPLSLVACEAVTVERHDMSKMTCEQVQTALRSGKGAILQTPSSRVPGMMRFEKYVADRIACGSSPNWGLASHVKTGDGQSCLVYRCISITRSTPRY